MIVNDSSDLLITFTWGNFKHGISGHLFECIEYYFIIKNHFKCKILLPEKIEKYKEIIQDKYNFTNKEIKDILDNTLEISKPTLLKTNNVLFVDGSYKNIKKINILAKKIIVFSCGDMTLLDHNNEKIYVLMDKRVYLKKVKNSFNYKKKLLLNYLRKIRNAGNKTLIYGTENCRKTDKNISNQLKLTQKNLPYFNLFENISSYYYTPIERKFDCSPRLLVECKFYDKDIIFDPEVLDYFENDLGLYWRWYDIENDFESLYLKEDDEIINILKELI